VEILGSGRCDSRERAYTARMSAKHRGAKGNDKTPKPDPIQEIAVYHIDLMAEVEGLLRSLTRTQQQVERLRSGGEAGALTQSQRREAVKLLSGNLKTFAAKLETLRDTLPEIQKAVDALEQSEAADE
jgi:hypothetical protein